MAKLRTLASILFLVGCGGTGTSATDVAAQIADHAAITDAHRTAGDVTTADLPEEVVLQTELDAAIAAGGEAATDASDLTT